MPKEGDARKIATGSREYVEVYVENEWIPIENVTLPEWVVSIGVDPVTMQAIFEDSDQEWFDSQGNQYQIPTDAVDDELAPQWWRESLMGEYPPSVFLFDDFGRPIVDEEGVRLHDRDAERQIYQSWARLYDPKLNPVSEPQPDSLNYLIGILGAQVSKGEATLDQFNELLAVKKYADDYGEIPERDAEFVRAPDGSVFVRQPSGVLSQRFEPLDPFAGVSEALEAERRLVEARRATEIAKKTRSAEEQFDAALDAGDLDKARMVRNFLDEPSEWQIELLKMQYADNLPALKILFDYVDAIGRADVVPEDARALVEGSTIYNPQTRQFEPFSQLGRPGEAPSALGQLKEIDPTRAEAAQRIVDPGAFTFGAPPFLGGAALPGEAPEEASERMFSRAMQESARTGGLGREGARFAAEEDILDPGYFSRRIPGVTPTEVRAREQEAAALGRPVTAPVPVGPEEPATRRPVPQVTPEEFRAQEAQAAALGRPVAAPPPERIPAVMPETFRDREAEAAALGRMVTGPPADRFAPEEEVRRRREAFMAQFRENALAQAAAGYQATPATFQPRGEGEIVGSYFNTIPIEDQLRYHKMVETPTGMRSEYEPQFRGTPSRGMAQLVNLQGDVTYVNASDPDSMKYYQDQGYTVRSIGPSLIGPSLPEPGPSRAEREASFIKEAQAFAPKKKTPKPFGTPRFVTS